MCFRDTPTPSHRAKLLGLDRARCPLLRTMCLLGVYVKPITFGGLTLGHQITGAGGCVLLVSKSSTVLGRPGDFGPRRQRSGENVAPNSVLSLLSDTQW